ncbi:hypothetical protein PVK06_039177 [Gossypium arboreum]|uniref:Uncharacterized protein n=1 Tax=Gossypium arboreum TaxID=29729 RepID=A0ABR0N276_GOSAR|nr:hypothetical protein PVK06_039177 [Gossypium arboreum]
MSGDSKGDFQWQILINSWKVWLVVSKFNGPERVCHFIGLLINERLFIKDERSRRGLADYPLCKIYGEAVETNPDVETLINVAGIALDEVDWCVFFGRKSVDYSYQKELSESARNHHNMAVKDGMGELLLEIFVVVVVVVETGCWHLVLKIAWDNGSRRVMVESDSMTLIFIELMQE